MVDRKLECLLSITEREGNIALRVARQYKKHRIFLIEQIVMFLFKRMNIQLSVAYAYEKIQKFCNIYEIWCLADKINLQKGKKTQTKQIPKPNKKPRHEKPGEQQSILTLKHMVSD